MELDEKQITNNINALIRRYGIKREDLANKLGITLATLVALINKPNKYSINKLSKLAEAIGCDIHEFYKPL